ncbi:hypothetical protein RM555_01215 [Micromonospora sp. DSM 115977]|uniref:WD40-like Beta Propeller Repeat n=1 Tax=Micromonospora reichwaldensis TaxID=3075516 RepID=A0ABU2WPN8_9ACTN|nr:hypothetical protein [Micromonospora sp. DSM 115977]MDT0527604.1 hypothetical protein [Micromonospora sp. DSM 115977]
MNDDRLRLDLTALADEVSPVDLRDRALRTSRRLGIRRSIATSAAVVAMLGAATGTAFALMARDEGPGPLPAASPTSTPTASPSAVPPPPNAVTPDAPETSKRVPPEATVGRIFYGPTPDGNGSDPARLWSFRPGSDPVRILAVPRPAAVGNAVVAPDGERVAWVDDSSYLRVARTDGTGARTYRTDLVDPDCWTPVWAPDSRRLLVSRVVSAEPSLVTEVGVVELSSGKFTRIGDFRGCHALWSANGKVLAFPDRSTGRVTLTDQSGGRQRSIPGLGGGAKNSCFDVASLSPDGSRIALRLSGSGDGSGTLARDLGVNAVLETRTGRKVDLDLGGRRLLQVYFQADGTMVARVGAGDRNVLVLLDDDGTKISETPEPTALKGQQILHVAG